MISFGTELPGIRYTERRAAYAVILTADGLVATVGAGAGLFLPGGGALPHETPEETVRREVREELGCGIRIDRTIGEAIQFFHAASEDTYYRMVATFCAGELTDVGAAGGEHALQWVSMADAEGALVHACHVWAVRLALRNTVPDGPPGTPGLVPAYDAYADEYAAGVPAAPDPATVLGMAALRVLAAAGELGGLAVCDLGCGEGHLTRLMAERGGQATGVDLSPRMVELARSRSASTNARFRVDDAERLATLEDGSFDLVVSNLALMDIANVPAAFAATGRVLRAGGRFVFSITHPCFQSPLASTITDAATQAPVRQIVRYATEGYWRSDWAAGVRGHVGAYHRTLSTYLNALIAAGFRIDRIEEPLRAGDEGLCSDVPAVLVVTSTKHSGFGDQSSGTERNVFCGTAAIEPPVRTRRC